MWLYALSKEFFRANPQFLFTDLLKINKETLNVKAQFLRSKKHKVQCYLYVFLFVEQIFVSTVNSNISE